MKKIFKNPIVKLALMALLIFLGTLVFAVVMSKKIESKAEHIFEKRSLLMIVGKSNENFLSLKKDYEIVGKKLPLIKNALPSEENIEELVVALENSASRTNNDQVLNFESLSSLKSEGEKIKSLKFTVLLRGNVGSFSGYLKEISKLPYFIEIEDVSLKNNSNIYDNNSQMDIKAKVYLGS